MEILRRQWFVQISARWLMIAAVTVAAPACRARTNAVSKSEGENARMSTNTITKSEAEWKSALSSEQYRVLRKKGTETPFSGEYWNHNAAGIYRCAGCGQPLFASGDKFDAGCGWPSFSAPAEKAAVAEKPDTTLGSRRTEILCARCGGHLGHVFEDGPQPTGLRYCINSAALAFEAANQAGAAQSGPKPR